MPWPTSGGRSPGSSPLGWTPPLCVGARNERVRNLTREAQRVRNLTRGVRNLTRGVRKLTRTRRVTSQNPHHPLLHPLLSPLLQVAAPPHPPQRAREKRTTSRLRPKKPRTRPRPSWHAPTQPPKKPKPFSMRSRPTQKAKKSGSAASTPT